MSDDLAWIPAPFTPAFEETAYVQWRDERVEKVVWEGRTYYREESGPVRRRAPFRVHDDGDRVACSLWALGAPLAHHLVLEADATTRVVAPSGAAAGPGRVLPPAVREGLVALVIALSAPPLASALREVTAGVVFTRGPLARDLVRVTDDEVRVSSTFADALSRRLAEPAAADARAYQALGALTELAVAMADPLRLRAQARLAAAAADGLVTALEHVDDDPDSARTITAAVERLLASGGVDDQPDVEGDEPDDGKH
jgi:hypothetical protein